MITINKFAQDTDAEIAAVLDHCRAHGWPAAVNDVWGQGGDGGRELGEAVLRRCNTPGQFRPIYDAALPLKTSSTRWRRRSTARTA